MKRALFSFVLLLGLAQSAWAQQLRYTTHVETRPVSKASSAPAVAAPYENLSVSMYDALLTDVKGQPYDITTVVNDQALRVESSAPRQGFPPGSVLILTPDRRLVVPNPQTRTYATMVSSPLVPPRPAAKPELSWRRTGESDQIAGTRVERVTFALRLTQPAANPGQAPPAAGPPGLPVKIVINGEAWVAPQYASYASLLARSYPYVPYAFPFLEELEKQGFVMRLVLRSELFSGLEVERRITRITEEPVAMDAFRPPEGYREALETKAEIQNPQILNRVQPSYTPEALQAKIAGSVLIEATVATDGSVQDARVLRSLDSKYGLDDRALAAVRQWRFKPGTLDGKPVSVRVTVEVGFSIKTEP